MTETKVNCFGFVELDISANVRRVKTSALFENPHRGYKSKPKWDKWIIDVVRGDATYHVGNSPCGPDVRFKIKNLVVSKGDKLMSCNFSVDRTITNSGDAVVGWTINGFVRFTIDFEGKTFKRWAMVHSEYGTQDPTYTWADPVQSAICTQLTSEVHHKMHLIAPRASGNPGADLVPRPTNKLISKPVQKRSFIAKSRVLSRYQVKRRVGGKDFVRIGNPIKGADVSSGNISRLMIPGFAKPVFNITSTTTFRKGKDDNQIFTLSPGRWMTDTIFGDSDNFTDVEIYNISFGAAHRASVSVASTPAKKEVQKKRFKNKNVFRRL